MARGLADKLKQRARKYSDYVAMLGLVFWGGTGLALGKMTLHDVFSLSTNPLKLLTFGTSDIPTFFLLLVTFYWYDRYKDAVVNEIDIINDCFDKGRPVDEKGLSGYEYIGIIGFLISTCYVGLCLSVSFLWVYCLIALSLHLSDLCGGSLVLTNLVRLFNKFTASDKFALSRREVVRSYYMDNPTLIRISGTTLVTALCLALSLKLPEAAIPYLYLFMAANVVAGEAIMTRWRKKRDDALSEIDRLEEAAMPSG